MSIRVPTYGLYGEYSAQKPDLWMHCETIASRSSLHRWEIRQHRHENFFQILYIRSGTGDAIFGEKRYPIAPHTAITVPPRVSHGFRFSKDIDGVVVTILASHLRAVPGSRSRLGAWLGAPHLTPLDQAGTDGAYVAATLMRLFSEFVQNRPGRSDLLDAYVTVSLQAIARLSDGAADQPSDETERRMEVLNDLIQRHLREHLPASFYAAQLKVSPAHLNRIVKTSIGHGVHELIARKLTEEAKRELVFTFASVQDISYRLGFADPAYFSRFFVKQTGTTPRIWRIAERAKLGI